jgi:type I restriction enzyme M protein
MVDMLDPQLGQTILDPACGTGGFLTCAIEHLNKQVKTADDRKRLQESIHGVEKKPLPHMLAMTNMMLHGIDVPTNVRHDNTLSRPLKDYGPRDRVDLIVTNPPFGGMEEDGIENNFPRKYQTRETADLFMALIMHLLKHDTGKAAVVLPDGFLFGEGTKTNLKRELLEEFNLHTIVRLPKGVFSPYTSIATNILFFEKGGPTKEVWFFAHPYPEGYKSYFPLQAPDHRRVRSRKGLVGRSRAQGAQDHRAGLEGLEQGSRRTQLQPGLQEPAQGGGQPPRPRRADG